jgi:hypothetical protein
VKPLTSAEVTETPSSSVTVAKPVSTEVWTVAEPRLLGHLTLRLAAAHFGGSRKSLTLDTYAHVLIDD